MRSGSDLNAHGQFDLERNPEKHDLNNYNSAIGFITLNATSKKNCPLTSMKKKSEGFFESLCVNNLNVTGITYEIMEPINSHRGHQLIVNKEKRVSQVAARTDLPHFWLCLALPY